MLSPIELHRRAVAEFDTRMRAIRDDQWSNPTPCEEWDVRALVNHIVNEDRWTSPLIGGKTIEEVGDAFDGDLLGEDPKGAWDDAAREARMSVDGVDGDLTRKVNVSWGQISAEEYIHQLWTDHLIHAWDLARGIGGDDKLDPELVEICLERSAPQEDFLKSTGAFGGKVEAPTSADAQTRLLAIFGRRA
jgi:uncharacterized protein (TIGR03086 family)